MRNTALPLEIPEEDPRAPLRGNVDVGEKEAYLEVSRGEETTRFAYPLVRVDDFEDYLGKVRAIEDAGLELASCEDLALLLNASFNSQDVGFKKNSRVSKIRNDFFKGSRKVYGEGYITPRVGIWTPLDVNYPGVYFAPYGELDFLSGSTFGRDVEFDLKNLKKLEEKLNGSGAFSERGVYFSEDRSVAFAPAYSIKGKSGSVRDAFMDGFWFSNFGDEGIRDIFDILPNIQRGNPDIDKRFARELTIQCLGSFDKKYWNILPVSIGVPALGNSMVTSFGCERPDGYFLTKTRQD